ncbi:hypothetical protein C8035_v011774 [Colletotrichum spinosum]|uniref:Adhesin domain-containing protein n=1 Tax=Colletotrichum spinosum TaxID=1347390 RepID=A0A4R8QBU6_9PEZI|nr:hypothetical protein C8035_v011774 [Colletotrichum spinosum]
MGAPEEERRLLGRDPESMGDEPYDDDDDDDDDGHRRPLPWRERALRKVPLASRRTVKMVLLVILVFVTFTGFLSALTSTVVSSPDKTPSKQPAKGYDPVTGLPIHTGPEAPSQPSDPSKPSQPGVPGHPTEPLPWNPQSMCAKNEHRFSTRVFNIAFEADKTLSVVQGVEADEPGRGYQPHVQGSFVVRRQLSNAPGPTIELEVVANDPALDVTVEWDSDAQHLDIKTPQRIEWNQSLRPCITVRATVWVPEDAHLRSIYLAALSMDVAVVDDLAITIQEELSVETISGDVQFPPKLVPAYKLDSRNIVIHTVSGDIRGNWPLYDSLKLGSNSGDIAGEVEPQAVLDSRPLPAVLEVSSVSGDISIKEPIERAYQSAKPDTVIYPRDYITIIDTKSGTVRAGVAFSTAASITTVSGDITATILPVYNVSLMQGVPEPDLRTTTKSGNVAVSVLEPLWVEIGRTLSRDGKSPTANPNVPVDIPTNPVPVPQPRIPSIPTVPFIPIGSRDPYRSLPGRLGDLLGKRDATVAALDAPPMRHLKSSHSTISGQVKVRYPGSWEGTINAETISGKISVEGKGVRIESRTQWPKSVKASKGQASACHADIGSTSGDISVLVGEK